MQRTAEDLMTKSVVAAGTCQLAGDRCGSRRRTSELARELNRRATFAGRTRPGAGCRTPVSVELQRDRTPAFKNARPLQEGLLHSKTR